MKFTRPKNLTYAETIRFHGHNGPFLALGYRLGKFLLKKHRLKDIMDFNIVVKLRQEKPFTCLVDGLQCSTFATMGKGNLMVKKNWGKDIIVSVNKGRKIYTYKITEKALDICLGAKDLHKAARKIFGTRSCQLFNLSL